MPISPDDVRHIARLARLALSDDEVPRFTRQLGAILEYVDKLKEVDVSGVESTGHAVPLVGPLRRDEPRPFDVREAVLAGAPRAEEGLFAVPKIIP